MPAFDGVALPRRLAARRPESVEAAVDSAVRLREPVPSRSSGVQRADRARGPRGFTDGRRQAPRRSAGPQLNRDPRDHPSQRFGDAYRRPVVVTTRSAGSG